MAYADWTGPAVEKLRRLWGMNWTASQIAAALNKDHGGGFTKNAVIGKSSRLGLPGRPNPKGRKGPVSGPTHEREPYQRRDADGHAKVADRDHRGKRLSGRTYNNPGAISMARLSRAADATRTHRKGAAEFLFAKRRIGAEDVKRSARFPEPLPHLDFRNAAAKANPAPSVQRDAGSEVPARLVDTGGTRPVPAKPWDGKPVTMLDLRHDQCAFVVEPCRYPALPMCCGAPVVAGSWCREHALRFTDRRATAASQARQTETVRADSQVAA